MVFVRSEDETAGTEVVIRSDGAILVVRSDGNTAGEGGGDGGR